MDLEKVRNRAYNLGLIDEDDDLNYSIKKGKRFMIYQDGKWIHFGAYPFKKGTYIDHGDKKIRKAWRARHSKILKEGEPAYKNKESPEYYSWYLLW